MFILVFLILILFLYLLCLKPNSGRREQMRPFEETYIAHRGFFDNHSEAPENSLAAFRRAVERGYGIELDVQLTIDHKLVVFHDVSLKRMCGVRKRLVTCTYKELQEYALADSEEKIPLFTDVLSVVKGQVPLIIEIKPEGDCIGAAREVARIMKDYRGVYCIESFHPRVVAWYRKHAPEVLRGQLSSVHMKKESGEAPPGQFVLANLLFNGYAKPDFIAYNHKYANQFSYWLCRKLYSVENAAWTIRSQAELEKAKSIFQIYIFDSFTPDAPG